MGLPAGIAMPIVDNVNHTAPNSNSTFAIDTKNPFFSKKSSLHRRSSSLTAEKVSAYKQDTTNVVDISTGTSSSSLICYQ